MDGVAISQVGRPSMEALVGHPREPLWDVYFSKYHTQAAFGSPGQVSQAQRTHLTYSYQHGSLGLGGDKGPAPAPL